MKNDARIRIEGLSDEGASLLLPIIRAELTEHSDSSRTPAGKKMAKLLRGAKVEIDHPDPPNLFEDEYDEVNWALGDLDELLSNEEEFGEATKVSEALADIKKMRKHHRKIEELLTTFSLAITKLESATLKKQKAKK